MFSQINQRLIVQIKPK